MTDPVVAITLIVAFVACVGAASWAGWLGGARSERALLRKWRSQLVESSPGDLLRRDDEIAEVVMKWWADGYSVGYRDGKNNKRRRDRARADAQAGRKP